MFVFSSLRGDDVDSAPCHPWDRSEEPRSVSRTDLNALMQQTLTPRSPPARRPGRSRTECRRHQRRWPAVEPPPGRWPHRPDGWPGSAFHCQVRRLVPTMGFGMGAPGYESPALFGRSAELDAVRTVVGQAARGRSRAVLIEGRGWDRQDPAADRGAGRGGRAGFRVLCGACDEVEQDRPLRALVEALGAGRELCHRLCVRGRRGVAGRRWSAWPPGRGPRRGRRVWVVVESVVDVLEDLSSTAPVVLAVEDLQWADPLTLRVLHAVVRRLHRIRLVLLATVRPGSHGVGVDRTVVDVLTQGALHVLLGSLDAGAAAELAAAVAGLPPGPGLLEQVGRAGGNPLFVIELVRALADDGALEVRDGRVDARWESPPPTLRLTLLRRLSQLPRTG